MYMCVYIYNGILRFPGGLVVRICLDMWVPFLGSLGQEDPVEKEMATHPSIVAWEMPWTEEPSGLQSMGSQNSQT